jgi:hypothetical protein
MNLDPIRNAAADVLSFFSTAIWPDPSIDDGTGLLMPAMAGIAAGMTVAFMLALYFQTGYRSYRDMIRHGLAAAVGLAIMAFAVSDMSNAALAYLVKTSPQPSSEFEQRWQKTSERAHALAAEIDRRLPEARRG